MQKTRVDEATEQWAQKWVDAYDQDTPVEFYRNLVGHQVKVSRSFTDPFSNEQKEVKWEGVVIGYSEAFVWCNDVTARQLTLLSADGRGYMVFRDTDIEIL